MWDKIKFLFAIVKARIAGLFDLGYALGITFMARFEKAAINQRGGIVTGILLVILVIVILGALIPVLWPTMQDSQEAIAAINGTDAPTAFLKTMFPVAILVVGLGIVAAIIFFALRNFGIIGGKGKKGF